MKHTLTIIIILIFIVFAGEFLKLYSLAKAESVSNRIGVETSFFSDMTQLGSGILPVAPDLIDNINLTTLTFVIYQTIPIFEFHPNGLNIIKIFQPSVLVKSYMVKQSKFFFKMVESMNFIFAWVLSYRFASGFFFSNFFIN